MAFNGFGKNSGPSIPPQSQTIFGTSPPQTIASDFLKKPSPSGHPSQSLFPLSSHTGSQEVEASTPVKTSSIALSKRPRSPPVRSAKRVSVTSHHDVASPSHPSSYTGLQDVATRIRLKPSDVADSKRPRSPPVQSANKVSLSSHHDSARLDTRTNSPFDDRRLEATRRTRSPPLVYDSSLFTKDLNQPSRDGQSSDVPRRTPSPPVRDDFERETQAKAKRLARFMEPTKPAQEFPKNSSNTYKQSQTPEEKQKMSANHHVEEASIAPNGSILGDNDDLESSTVIVGLCHDMCPESEREERERKGDLDKYERLDGDRNQTTKYLAVKKYNRTAEREAILIRPMPVLQKTITYLLGLLDQPYDEKFLGMYNFLWDRMRAIRMDLRMQHLFNQHAIVMLEQMIRLHIIAMHELCEYAKGEGFSEGFDAHLNIEQMNKASVELFQMYDDHRKRGIRVTTEQEFRGYYALLKLDKHPGYKVEPAELSHDLSKMTQEMKGSPDILFAREVARACRTGNYIAFFRLARRATYLQACLMHAHFSKLRTQALASLHSGLQNNQGIPISEVIHWLAMEEEDIEDLLEYHGFSIKNFGVPYMVKEGPFLHSDDDFPNRCSKLVHLKKSRTIRDDVRSPQISYMSADVQQKVSVLKKLPNFVDRSSRSVEVARAVNKWDDQMLEFEDAPISSDVSTVKALPEGSSSVIQNTVSESQASRGFYMPTRNPSDSPAKNGTFGIMKTSVSPAKIGTFGLSIIDTSNSPLSGSQLGKWHFSPKETLPTTVTQTISHDETSSKSILPEDVHSAPAYQMVQKSSFQKPEQFAGESPPERLLTEQLTSDEDVIKHVEDDLMPDDEQNEVVALAKLRLIIRIWKRRCSKLRDLQKQQRLLAASAALSSLSLGPPIRQCKSHRVYTGELNMDRVLKKRFDRRSKSWSKINVAQLVGQILSERNPFAKCLCWKLVICSQVNHTAQTETTNHSASKWLLSKLMPAVSKDDNELAFCSSGIAIWKHWVLSKVIKHESCILSVIRDVQLESKELSKKDVWGGAGAITFLVLKHFPWDLQRAQLHKIASSVPINSCLPLLVLVSGIPEGMPSNPSNMAVDRLGLNSLDKSRISNFMVVFLSGDEFRQDSNGFFSDDRLREGLKWLADQAPVQPVLHEIKMRELALNCLAASVKELGCREFSEVKPRDCISVFNQALDHVAEQILSATVKNPTGWPCSEIRLLKKSTYEQVVANSFLPSIGWSSAERIVSIIERIKSCKLPLLDDIMSWLDRGSVTGKEIQLEHIISKKLELKRCLVSYLTGAMLMPAETAERESDVMLQNAVLERNDLGYRIIPKWVAIFRRIFNWRLETLVGENFSSVFVLENPTFSGSEDFDFGTREMDESSELLETVQSSNGLNPPGLDELIEASCPAVVAPEFFHQRLESGEVTWSTANGIRNLGEPPVVEATDPVIETLDTCMAPVRIERKENKTSRLDALFQQCTIMQDRIDEKLKFYF